MIASGQADAAIAGRHNSTNSSGPAVEASESNNTQSLRAPMCGEFGGLTTGDKVMAVLRGRSIDRRANASLPQRVRTSLLIR